MRRLWLEYAVAATLLASFVTVPLPIPHIALGSAWAALVVAHVVRWRRVYRGVLRRGPHLRSVTTTALIGTAVVVTVSGFAQWAGVAAAIPWHAASSTLLLLLVAGHATRRLRRRFSARRARADARPAPAVPVVAAGGARVSTRRVRVEGRSARVDTKQRSDDHWAQPLQAGGAHAHHPHHGESSSG